MGGSRALSNRSVSTHAVRTYHRFIESTVRSTCGGGQRFFRKRPLGGTENTRCSRSPKGAHSRSTTNENSACWSSWCAKAWSRFLGCGVTSECDASHRDRDDEPG